MNKKPLILNIESATGTCSVCVSRGTEILDLQEADQEYQHSKVLTNLIDKCLKGSNLTLGDLDALAVSSGPGSYTSLRVGVSTAKGICYALDKPLIRVGTLRALALAAQREVQVSGAYYCPMIDARRMEVYCSIFDADNNPVSEPAAVVVDNNTFVDAYPSGGQLVFCGNGAEKCRAVLGSERAVFHPSACSAAYLPPISSKRFWEGEFEDVAYFTPFYLKPPNITAPKPKGL